MTRLVPGLTKARLPQVRQYCHINSDLENIEQEDCAEPLHARILQDILSGNVIVVVLFLAKSCFRWDVNNSLKITALTMYR